MDGQGITREQLSRDTIGARQIPDQPMPQEASPAELEAQKHHEEARSRLYNVRERLDFLGREETALRMIERSLVAALEVSDPNAKMTREGPV